MLTASTTGSCDLLAVAMHTLQVHTCHIGGPHAAKRNSSCCSGAAGHRHICTPPLHTTCHTPDFSICSLVCLLCCACGAQAIWTKVEGLITAAGKAGVNILCLQEAW